MTSSFTLKRVPGRAVSCENQAFTAQNKHICRHTTRTGRGFVFLVNHPQVTVRRQRHLWKLHAAKEKEAHWCRRQIGQRRAIKSDRGTFTLSPRLWQQHGTLYNLDLRGFKADFVLAFFLLHQSETKHAWYSETSQIKFRFMSLSLGSSHVAKTAAS